MARIVNAEALLMAPEITAAPGVFGGHQVDLAEDAEGSDGDIVQMPDGRRDDKERTGHEIIVTLGDVCGETPWTESAVFHSCMLRNP